MNKRSQGRPFMAGTDVFRKALKKNTTQPRKQPAAWQDGQAGPHGPGSC